MTANDLKQLGITIAVVFVGTVLSQYIALGVDLTEVDASTGHVLLNSGVTAVVTAILGWLTPWYRVYGIGSTKNTES